MKPSRVEVRFGDEYAGHNLGGSYDRILRLVNRLRQILRSGEVRKIA